jgi:hypothetical protein
MNKMLAMLVALAAVAWGTPTLAETVSSETKSKTTVKQEADGDYHRKQTTSTEATDASGTTTSLETKVKVEADEDGNAEKKVTTETVIDPKGLMNKSKTVTTDTVTQKDGKLETTHKRKVDGKTVEDTKETSEPK